MRLDRILALALIVLCFVAALGNWLSGLTPDRVEAPSFSRGRADVALIDMSGVISDGRSGGPLSTPTGANVDSLLRAIRSAREDGVKGILVRINSPGGTAPASQAIYNELMRTRKETNIKIVANLGDVAASGGYYVASAAHHIVANPSTLTGSIGVIIQTTNVTSLLDKVGVKMGTIQSGPLKDILSPFRSRTPAEDQVLESIVDESYQQFLTAIAAGRNLSLDKLKPLADGRIFTGSQALKVQLVDSLGNYYDALDKMAELAGIPGEPTVRNYSLRGWSESLNQLFSSSLSSWIPGDPNLQLRRWHKIPLTLME